MGITNQGKTEEKRRNRGKIWTKTKDKNSQRMEVRVKYGLKIVCKGNKILPQWGDLHD